MMNVADSVQFNIIEYVNGLLKRYDRLMFHLCFIQQT